MKSTKKGFTLIELLVVIAIIGILSSVVLTSLNTARSKGSDAAVKSNLKGIGAQAAIVENDDGSYDNVCADTNITNAVNAAGLAGGGTGVCNDSPSEWAASAPLKVEDQFGSGSGVDYWCVDQAGSARVIDDALGAVTLCP
ncbi:MAG: type II secretion system protein [Parcubacteria group bacterium]